MASTTTSPWRSATSSPGCTSTRSTRPGIGATMRWVPAAAPPDTSRRKRRPSTIAWTSTWGNWTSHAPRPCSVMAASTIRAPSRSRSESPRSVGRASTSKVTAPALAGGSDSAGCPNVTRKQPPARPAPLIGSTDTTWSRPSISISNVIGARPAGRRAATRWPSPEGPRRRRGARGARPPVRRRPRRRARRRRWRRRTTRDGPPGCDRGRSC